MSSATNGRLRLVASTLAGTESIPGSGGSLRRFVAGQVGDDLERLWLLMAVVTATLPKADDVLTLQRRARLDGPAAAVKDVERLARTRYALRLADAVEVVSGVVVDVDHTARSSLVTGIQRVVRQTISHWARDRRFTLLGWDDSYSRLRRLNPAERENALWGTTSQALRARRTRGVVVPWDCEYVLIELATETERTARIQALGQLSPTRLHIVGHDCVPITTAETVGPGMGGVFAKTLSAVAVATNVATTSVASTAEYAGWRRTLSAIGLSGPRIGEVMLPTDVDEAALTVARAGAMQSEDANPLLLSVGSHEPRKNHLSILQAAEILWREGHNFRLAFVGGNSWNSEEFSRLSGAMKDAGRQIETLKGLSDDALWKLYASASLTLFPSVNEGFGLPVAESLAMGVPVITSDFGSMREIAQAGGGALLVDPRDDRQIADSIRSFLTTPSLRDRLRSEAASRARRPWQAYADELWSFFGLSEFSRPASPLDVA